MTKISITLFLLLAVLLPALITGENVLADETIPFTQRAGIKFVTVQMNGVPIELVFDTGANSIVINNDVLQRLGITEYSTARKLNVQTAGCVIEGYILTFASVKLGNIEKNNYDISFVPSSTKNLLGASFFAGYNYYIDEDNSVIRLIPKGSYLFNNPSQTPAPADVRQKAINGRIEVEMDGKKYIYGNGWEESK